MSKWPFQFRRNKRQANISKPVGQLQDVTSAPPGINLADLEIIQWVPVWMTRSERLLLYTLAFTLRPERYLEIGTLHGGSALLVAAALDSLGLGGRMICVDPRPQIAPEHWQRLAHRATLLEGYSPDILPKACELAGGPFDFILIDGDHTQAGVLRDARGVLSFAADGAYILFHDSYYFEVTKAVDAFVREHSHDVVDFGLLTREFTVAPGTEDSGVRWGGLRMLQVRRAS